MIHASTKISVDLEKIHELTEKQQDVLSCLVFGLSYKEIGLIIGISNRTVECHVRDIIIKTKSSNRNVLISRIALLQDKNLYNEFKNRFNELKSKKPTETRKGKNNVVLINRKTISIFVFIVMFILLFSFYKSKDCKTIKSIGINSYFLNRNDIISKIKPNFFDKKRIVELVGQGGAGKTTIAREYLRACNSNITYELNSETLESVTSGLIGLSHLLAKTKQQKLDLSFINGISNETEKRKQISIFVFTCLKQLDSWCLLFDNVDDFEMLKDILDTNVTNGQVIITTRNHNIGNYFVESSVIKVKELTEKEKIKLFEMITNEKIKTNNKNLLLEIPSYPLDVSSSAYYIKNSNISLKEYIKRMHEQSSEFWTSNKVIIKENTNYDKTRESIISSIFDKIVKNNEKFKKILFFIALMDSQSIPLGFLKEISDKDILDALMFQLKKYGITNEDKQSISIHRSVQLFALTYFQKCLSEQEKNIFLKEFVSKLVSYKKISNYFNDYEILITHLKSINKHLINLNSEEERIHILITIGNLLKSEGISAFDSVDFFDMALALNKKVKKLNLHEIAEINLKAGEACVISNKNKEALKYLNASFVSLGFVNKYAVDYAKNYNLLGILQMRNNNFRKANESFDKALNILGNIKNPNNLSDIKLTTATSYECKGMNYFLYYINKPQMSEAIFWMKKGIETIGITNDINEIKKLTYIKIKMAGIYNGTMKYSKALKIVDETKILLKKILLHDNYYYCTLGFILMEEGHSMLRLNRLNDAKKILRQASELFDKTMIGDHSFRVKMQEAETLIRLGYYDDAYKNCLDVLGNKNREKNDYNELFFNLAYYNAGLIKYKTDDLEQSILYFKDFIIGMNKFCKHFLSKEKYEKLINDGAFNVISNEKDIKNCLKQSYEIFKTVCMKNSEFITDYVRKNYETAIN